MNSKMCAYQLVSEMQDSKCFLKNNKRVVTYPLSRPMILEHTRESQLESLYPIVFHNIEFFSFNFRFESVYVAVLAEIPYSEKLFGTLVSL